MATGLLLVFALLNGESGDWPQFRGPTGDGVATARGVPTTWSETKNIAWKVQIPGRGRSSPVVLGNRIWLTTAVEAQTPTKEEKSSTPRVSLRAVCLDRSSGKLLSDTELFSLEKPEPVHPLNSHATPTPVVESERLFADFGAYGTACLETATGRILWKAKLAVDHQLGPGSSTAVYKDWLFLVRDGCDAQYVAALEKQSGSEAWRTPRPPIVADSGPYKKSFSSPLVVESNGRVQVIAPGPHWVVAYDPASGRELWRVRHGDGYSIAPRPVFGNGMAYVCTGGYVSQLWAIRVDGNGDVTDTHVAWKATGQIPLMASPLLAAQEIYFVSDNGVATCLDARTGKVHWRERIGGNFCASPVYAEGRVYFFSREGKATICQAGPKFHRLAENQLEGTVIASPAVVASAILLRTDTHLYCIRSASGPAS